MKIAPRIFKRQGLRALRGHWKTALLVTFVASVLVLALQLIQPRIIPSLISLIRFEAARASLLQVPLQSWLLVGLLNVVVWLITPALYIGNTTYFIQRIRGTKVGFTVLFSQMNIAGKSFVLYFLICAKTFLWSLLLLVPGIIAYLRYALAPYYLAQDPQLSPAEALRKSKETMKDKKMSLWRLLLSFLGWELLAALIGTVLLFVNVILWFGVVLVAQEVIATYMSAAMASFFLAVTVPGGVEKAEHEETYRVR